MASSRGLSPNTCFDSKTHSSASVFFRHLQPLFMDALEDEKLLDTLITEIMRWQRALWTFQPVGHIGKLNGPKPGWNRTQPSVQQSFEVAVSLDPEGRPLPLHLSAQSITGDSQAPILWSHIEVKIDDERTLPLASLNQITGHDAVMAGILLHRKNSPCHRRTHVLQHIFGHRAGIRFGRGKILDRSMAGCAGIRSEFRWEPDPLHPNHAGRCRLRLYPGLGVSSDPVHCLEPLGSAGAHTGQDEISRCGCSPQSDGKSGHSMAKPFSWGAELESPDSGCPSRVWQWCRMVPEVAKRSARTLSSGRTHGDQVSASQSSQALPVQQGMWETWKYFLGMATMPAI